MIKISLPELPEPTIYRTIKSIECQAGTLGLFIDFSDYFHLWSISVGLYIPSTSLGYLSRVNNGDYSIIRQVDDISSKTLLKVMNFLKQPNPIHIGNNTVMFNTPFPELVLALTQTTE